MKDIMLVSLITLAAEEPPIEHDVTLLVGGFLISGFVISYEKYVQHHPTTAGFESAIQQIQTEENLESTEYNDNFIHLRDAKYYVPGANPIPGNMGVFVRISLEAIQGFSFGKLEVA